MEIKRTFVVAHAQVTSSTAWEVEDLNPLVRPHMDALAGQAKAQAFILIQGLFRWGLDAPGVEKLPNGEGYRLRGGLIEIRFREVGPKHIGVSFVGAISKGTQRTGS